MRIFVFTLPLLLFGAFSANASLTVLDLSKCHQLFQKTPELKRLVLGDEPLRIPKEWTSDFLVKTSQEIEQVAFSYCRTKRAEAALDLVRRDYLERLGFTATELDKMGSDILYRAFSGQKAVADELKKKFASVKPRPVSAEEWIAKVYQSKVGVTENKIVLIAPTEELLAALQKVLKPICSQKDVGFCDERVLYRVQVVERKGVGAFVPELGVLLLSKELLSDVTSIHRFVFWHELTHVAIESSKLRGERWLSEFQELSGWKRQGKKLTLNVKDHPARAEDLLSEQAKLSAFTILPDPVVVAKNYPEADGFVLAKSFRDTLSRNNISEDLADHVAAAIVIPSRYCWGEKPLAPRKFEWVKKNIDPKLETPTCLVKKP